MANFMGPTWGPPGSCRPQMGPMLAPWTLLSGMTSWHGNVYNEIGSLHYNDVIMSTIASQITSLRIVYSTVIRAQIKENIKVLRHWPLCGESPGPVNSPHKGPVTRKMFPFDDVIMVMRTTGNQLIAFTKSPGMRGLMFTFMFAWISSPANCRYAYCLRRHVVMECIRMQNSGSGPNNGVVNL